jgi:aerotolerance regulator-like protein
MIAWLNPAALAGLALLAGPVLVHLLLRHRADRVPFPSLRFVRPSRTAAVRVRLPSDLALLLLRMAIVALAVVALAQPLLLARPRLAAWNARMARAIVLDVSDSMKTSGALAEAAGAAKDEGQGAVFAARIDAPELRLGVLQAVEQLATAPPARREIVVVSDFQRGALARADLETVPPGIGIRLVQVGAAPQERRVRGLDLFGTSGSPAHEVLLAQSTTAVSIVPGSGSREGLRLVAAEADGGALHALERTVASAGAPAPSPNQPLAIVFAGGPGVEGVREISAIWMVETVLRMRNDRDLTTACSDPGSASPSPASPSHDPRTSDRIGPEWHVLCRDPQSRPVVRAAAAGSQLALDVDAPPSALLSAAVVRAALTARYGTVARAEEEIQRMTAAELRAWSRQPPPVAADAWRFGRQSDNRWCWALALVLLLVESAVRRQRIDAPHEVRADAA